MRLNEVSYTDARPVDGYGPGFFRIGGEVQEGALVLSASGLAPWSGYEDADTLLERAGDADVLRRRVPRASVRVLEGLGHLAHEECPALWADSLSAFLDGVAERVARAPAPAP